ncbi:MAG: hypothetical protein ACYDDC_01695 [Thermoplasmataceae archaeon]
MDIEKIEKIMFLSNDDRKELLDNKGTYSDILDDLEGEYLNYMENLNSISELHSKLATINFESYENFMNVHKNAIVIKSTLTEMKIMGIEIKSDENVEIQRLIDHYLLIKGFK